MTFRPAADPLVWRYAPGQQQCEAPEMEAKMRGIA